MSSESVGPLLRYIRQMATGRKDSDLPDHQLLERFATFRDESAFAALLRRHGPMVLSVCQSVLHNLHDAENAFQAAFLVLAQKAGSIQRRDSVSSWLYRVAYHLAVKAQASAARRKDLEKRAAVMPSADPLLDLNLRELRGVLFEELDRLPENYRAPLVLCYLEEKTQEEAARLLGWSKGAVIGRLQRGRELLRKRLRQRGLTLSASLAASALALGSASAAVPASLSASTLQAALQLAAGRGTAAGLVLAQVAALVEGASTMMFVNKAKIVTALLLALSAGIAGFAAMKRGVRAADPPEDAKSAEAAKAENRSALTKEGKPAPKDSITVRGRVLDPDGKPVADAKLYLGHYGPKDAVAVSEKAKSDVDGRFQFDFPKSQLSKAQVVWRDPWEDPWDDPLERVKLMQWQGGDRVGQVMAVAAGLGCDWVRLDPKAACHELTLRLVKDVPVNGCIMDSEGKPVAGARLRVANVQAGGDLKETLEALRDKYHKKPVEGQAPPKPKEWKDWSGPVPGQGEAVTTGEDGRFHLAGFGGERLVIFQVEGSGIATGYFRVMTRLSDAVVRPEFKGKIPGWSVVENGRLSETVSAPLETVCYGATFRYLAAASRPIRGVVMDKKTGKPLASVTVSAFGTKEDGLPRFRSVPETPVYARTDREGRYELLGCEKSPVYSWSYYEPEDRGHYFPLSKKIEDTAGLKPLTANFEIIPGSTVVRGKVRNERTGKPIPGCRVYYFPLFPNPATNQFRGWGGGMVGHLSSCTMTGADGSFTVAALPGPGVLCVRAPDVDGMAPFSPSRLYSHIPITPQEFKDFSKRHNVVLGAPANGSVNSEKFIVCADVGQGSYPRDQSMWGNRLALIHPGEKEEELKLDVALRPQEEGAGKSDSKKDKEP
jgi:RNA polymerase sigma factor (sigma-70 family)